MEWAILWLLVGWLCFEAARKGTQLKGIDLRDHMTPVSAFLLVLLWPLILMTAILSRRD